MSTEPEPIHEPEFVQEPEPPTVAAGSRAAIGADPTPPALPPPPPPPAPAGPAARFVSNALLMVLGAVLAAGGYALARAYAPPRPPTEVVTPGSEAVKPADLKALAGRDENIESQIDGLSKRIDMLPNPAPELKTLHDQDDANGQKLTAIAGRLDSIDERLGQTSKNDVQAVKPTIDEMSKRLDELGRQVATLKDQVTNSKPAPAPTAEDANVEGRAMEQAAALFKERKYAEARAAFAKLQEAFPGDARVWYYSALANGFATNQWTGETERLINTGLEKEKAGSPPSAKVDALFADLTTATGKDWLAGYRKRIGAR